MIQPLTLSTKEAAAYLGVGRDKLLALHKAKRVRALDLDGRLRFTTESLQAFLGSLPDSLETERSAMSVTLRKLPPDPEGRNPARADCALTTMGEFQGRTRSDVDTAVTDLICCLMHLCDYFPDYGPFADHLDLAQRHYRVETADDYEAAHNSFGMDSDPDEELESLETAFYAEVERVNKRVAELASGRRFKVTQITPAELDSMYGGAGAFADTVK